MPQWMHLLKLSIQLEALQCLRHSAALLPTQLTARVWKLSSYSLNRFYHHSQQMYGSLWFGWFLWAFLMVSVQIIQGIGSVIFNKSTVSVILSHMKLLLRSVIALHLWGQLQSSAEICMLNSGWRTADHVLHTAHKFRVIGTKAFVLMATSIPEFNYSTWTQEKIFIGSKILGLINFSIKTVLRHLIPLFSPDARERDTWELCKHLPWT